MSVDNKFKSISNNVTKSLWLNDPLHQKIEKLEKNNSNKQFGLFRGF